MLREGQRVRLKDIAGALGVSPATVSLCLNAGHTRYQISAETVRRVRAYAEKVGYIPDRNARNLRNGGRRCIGLLTNGHWRAGQKCLPAVFSAAQTLGAHGIETRQVSAADQLEGLAQLRELGCDEAIIFAPVVENGSGISRTMDSEIVRKKFPGLKLHSVDYSMPMPGGDLPPMSRLGVPVWEFHEKLFRLMKESYPGEIMMHSWRCSQPCVRQLQKRSPELIFRFAGENPFQIGAQGAHQYLALRRRMPISTVFWGDDRMACGFIKELLRHGVAIPDEVNVISFDNLDFSQHLAIPLTTWGVPIVRHTALVLDRILNGGEPLTVISRPVMSPGESARFTPEMLRQVREWCDLPGDPADETPENVLTPPAPAGAAL